MHTMPNQSEGTVVRSRGSWYTVRIADGHTVPCKVKGNFRLMGIRSTNPVAVGDRVSIVVNAEGSGYIVSIAERSNLIVRKASNLSKQSHILAANIDQVLLIATIVHPETSTVFIDRFLASAEAYRVPVILAFNKIDAYGSEEMEQLAQVREIYDRIGYRTLSFSATTGLGCMAVEQLLKDKITLLSGHSGVGKSTLVNRLLPHLNLRTAEISSAHNTGMHTTTFSEMYALPAGGQLIDTPGIKGFGTFDVEREEVGHYFREIFAKSAECRFGAACTHTHEPSCAVLQAVEAGEIALSRYNSYLSMLEDKDQGKYRAGY